MLRIDACLVDGCARGPLIPFLSSLARRCFVLSLTVPPLVLSLDAPLLSWPGFPSFRMIKWGPLAQAWLSNSDIGCLRKVRKSIN